MSVEPAASQAPQIGHKGAWRREHRADLGALEMALQPVAARNATTPAAQYIAVLTLPVIEIEPVVPGTR